MNRFIFWGAIAVIAFDIGARTVVAGRVTRGILEEAGAAATSRTVREAASAAGREFADRLTTRDLVRIGVDKAREALT